MIHVAEVTRGDETRLVDAFEFIPGEIAESPDSGIDFFHLGSITAELHRHARGWTPPDGFRRFSWDLGTMLGSEGRWGDWRDAPNLTDEDRESIERAEEKVRERLTRFGTGSERFGLVHSDLRLSNLIVDDRQIVVIDFDDCGWSWYLTDLAATITWNEAADDAGDLVEQWLLGYLANGDLEPAAIEEIPTFVMLRRLMITAWIGTHPEAEPARLLGGHLASETAALGRRYLDDPSWFAYDHDDLLGRARPAASPN
ncbi:phosphotransferase enzyme family protein [Gordonia sp. FQ]|uniref:phosphotransferase enzyme family protein n=1 Tax=Gordonia sp. FQ TaxID=3446634 RepID=UPI003F82ADBE